MTSHKPGALRDAAREATLARLLSGNRFGAAVHAFGEIASTMDEAHRLAAGGCPEGTLVIAERQTRGRGRLGREWVSGKGGLYFSVVLRPARPLSEIPQLALVAGLSVAEAVRAAAPELSPAVKWPNDVLTGDRKLAGILVEARGGVIVGIGINVSTAQADLPDTATSIAARGCAVDPDAVLARFAEGFDKRLTLWETKGFDPIRAALRPLMAGFGRVIRLKAGTQTIEGQAADLDEQGRLQVRLDAGMIRAFGVGEVTVLR